VKQIQKGRSGKSLFLHIAPSTKFTPPTPPLRHEENITEKYQFSNDSGTIY